MKRCVEGGAAEAASVDCAWADDSSPLNARFPYRHQPAQRPVDRRAVLTRYGANVGGRRSSAAGTADLVLGITSP